MDFGKNFYDGKRIFGNNKTFRGFFFGLAIGIVVGLMECVVFGFPILFSVLIPLGALLGDLTGAFLKRRLGIAPGGLLPIVDQVDFVVGAIVFSIPLAIVNWEVGSYSFADYSAYSLIHKFLSIQNETKKTSVVKKKKTYGKKAELIRRMF